MKGMEKLQEAWLNDTLDFDEDLKKMKANNISGTNKNEIIKITEFFNKKSLKIFLDEYYNLTHDLPSSNNFLQVTKSMEMELIKEVMYILHDSYGEHLTILNVIKNKSPEEIQKMRDEINENK